MDVDGLKKYWHVQGDERRVAMRRHSGGGGIMVWGGFSSLGKTKLAFVEVSMDSSVYIDTLTSHFIPFAWKNHGANFIFQQDNASCHRSRKTMGWLRDMDIEVMEWPALSPDLNPVENLWSIVSERVYSLGKQYSSTSALRNAVLEAWDGIPQETLTSLIRSLPKRCEEVKGRLGAFTTY